MQYAENTMNVVWRNVFAIRNYLNSQGHECEWVSVIAQNNGSKFAGREASKLNQYLSKRWDIVLVAYSAWYVHVDAAKAIVASQKGARVGWLTTDYEINRHGAFNPYHFVISNFEESFYDGKSKFYENFYCLNLNTLIYHGINSTTEKKYDCLYYGRYREDRAKYFKQYLQGRVTLSTSSKNVRKFKLLGCKSDSWVDHIDWTPGRETLNLFRSYLYIEDQMTHKIFNHLANRWYEGLTCRSIPFIDESCRGTFQKSGIEIPEPLYIHNYTDLVDRLDNINALTLKYNDNMPSWDKQAS